MEQSYEFQRLHKKAIGCMRLGSLVNWGIFLLLLAAVRFFFYLDRVAVPPLLDSIFLGLALLIVLYVVISPFIRYRRYRYLISDQQVVVLEGLWFIQKDLAPIERIHQISVKRGPILRAYGLSQVSCITAGGILQIKYLEEARADEIAALLQARIHGIIQRQQAEVMGNA